MKLWSWIIAAFAPRRRLKIVDGDTLPEKLPLWNLVLARDGDEDWAVGMRCPCGCGQRLEMLVLKGVKPRWDVSVNSGGHVTLHPSVAVQQGCRSHFLVRAGKIIWCE